MQLALSRRWSNSQVWAAMKSFSIWSATLGVCLLVVGFPVVAVTAAVGAIAAVALQSVLPVSAVLVVAGSLLGASVLGIFASSAVLTARGIHPETVSWLGWLRGDRAAGVAAIYASCPLSCALSDRA